MTVEQVAKDIAGYKRSFSELYRCRHCQHFTGTGCTLVKGSINSDDVCDLFSGHRPWQ